MEEMEEEREERKMVGVATPSPAGRGRKRKLPPTNSKGGSAVSCSVAGCGQPKPPFHAFPERAGARRWIEACHNAALAGPRADLADRYVCHKHFSDMFIYKFNRLSKGAYPTLHLPNRGPRGGIVREPKTPSVAAAPKSTPDKSPKKLVDAHWRRMTEEAALGGLLVGRTPRRGPPVLLAEDREVRIGGASVFPTLAVHVRTDLCGREDKEGALRSRNTLDTKVKGLLVLSPMSLTEWLMHQGMLRRRAMCPNHQGQPMKLGICNEDGHFPHSGGYVWVADCCRSRYVSVYNGSLFEGNTQPPVVMLKLVYHWACQTNYTNVVQWVKIDNAHVRRTYTWLRSVCSAALHCPPASQTCKPYPLGGPNVHVQLGIISLGTTSKDGKRRNVKVEVVGVLDEQSRCVRLYAAEPLPADAAQRKAALLALLEPVTRWVHPKSLVLIDTTVEPDVMASLQLHNYKRHTDHSHSTVMAYLRKAVPRMFQNALSALSRPLIQQFLDELAWREQYAATCLDAFNNIVKQAAAQTEFGVKGLLNDLDDVAKKAFKVAKRTATTAPTAATAAPVPYAVQPDVDPKTSFLPLENYYLATIPVDKSTRNSGRRTKLDARCCGAAFTTNISFMEHLFRHAVQEFDASHVVCRYCMQAFGSDGLLRKHLQSLHAPVSKFNSLHFCLICQASFVAPTTLFKHMGRQHRKAELPYKCQVCGYRTSTHKDVIDHFYGWHDEDKWLQCPLCLWIVSAEDAEKVKVEVMQHMETHTRKTTQYGKKCDSCCLRFEAKETTRQHRAKMHDSLYGAANLKKWIPVDSQCLPMEEKYLQLFNNSPPSNRSSLGLDAAKLSVKVPKTVMCKECASYGMWEVGHYKLGECAICGYVTWCAKAMATHRAACKSGGRESDVRMPVVELEQEMFCGCGFSSRDGNALAKHLAICERITAYPTAEAAKGGTTARSMLDVLGLMRRSDAAEESSTTPPPVVKMEVQDEEDGVVVVEKSDDVVIICDDDDDDDNVDDVNVVKQGVAKDDDGAAAGVAHVATAGGSIL